MKLYLRMLEKLLELPECVPATAASSPLRHLLDDLIGEVKGVELAADGGVVFTVENLANRGDHLYAIGIAREVAGRTLAQVKMPALAAALPERKPSVVVKRATDLCLRYGLLELSVPERLLLRNDVAACLADPGKRHPLVDLLNYVQQEFGQPMHAFDAECIEGELVVDCTQSEEQVEALDGASYRVPAGAIVIRDRKKIVAVAGVIGCANSMVKETTRKVLVEAAVFDPVSVRLTARAMGIATEASHFFERGVDLEGVVPALKRLVYLAEGSAGAVSVADSAHALGFVYTESAPAEKRRVSVSLADIRAHLNLPRLDEVEVAARLKNLGFGVEVAAQGKDRIFTVVVPSWRLWDVSHHADMIEEVARAVGLNRIRPQLPPLQYEPPERDPSEVLSEKLRPALCGLGFIEVITKGFYSATDVAVLESLEAGSATRHIGIKNAIEQENSHLKITNVVHMVRLMAANQRRGVRSAKVYEVCRLFTRPDPSQAGLDQPRPHLPFHYDYERDVLTLAAAGRWSEGEWRKGEPLEELVRLFSGAVQSVVRSIGGVFSVGKSDARFLHPGMQGSVKSGRSVVGMFGVVHPRLAEAYDLRTEVLYAEFDLAALSKALRGRERSEQSDLPPITRDLTLQVGVREQAGRIVRLIEEAGVESLSGVDIIDDFRRSEEDFRRVTYRLTFQRGDRTLRHEEADAAVQGVLARLSEKSGVVLA
jgi:phenylalanyl-tRNA synthetase beta chain